MAAMVWRMASPLIYVAGPVPVLIGTVLAVSWVETRIGFWNDRPGIQLADLTTFRYNGDVLALAMILLLGGLVFGLLSSALSQIEGSEAPTLADHLRHCTVLYVISGLLVYFLTASYEELAAHGTSLGYGLAALAFLAVGYAIIVNALVLWRRRSSRDNSEVDV